MNRKEFMIFLADAESSFPVTKWKYEDVHLWPLIKRDLFFHWYNSNQPVKKKQVKYSALYKSVRLAKSFLFWVFLSIRKKEKKSVFYCGSFAHRVNWKGELINRYFQPLIDEKPEENNLQIEYGAKKKGQNYKNESSLFYLQDYLYAAMFLVKRRKQPQLILPKWDAFEDELEEKLGINKKSYRMKVQQMMLNFSAHVLIYQRLIKYHRPEKCLALYYYSIPVFSLLYVMNKNGIPTTDIQHGGQGTLHPMYNFSVIPQKGYTTLPQYFWCWDEVSARTIRSWLSKQKFHHVQVKGNPWIDFLSHQNEDWKYDNKKQIILYTLQETSLDGYLLKAIKNSPSSYEWWLRTHPRMKEGRILEQLNENAIDDRKYNLDDSVSLPLPVILKHATVHLSKYSGSVIESLLLGTKTIIISEVGVKIYKDYIEKGEAIKCTEENASVLLEKIKRLVEEDN